MAAYLYITAKDRTLNDVKRLFLYLRDYDDMDRTNPDWWSLRLSEDIPADNAYEDENGDDEDDESRPPPLPLLQYDHNKFAGYTIEQLENFTANGDMKNVSSFDAYIVADDQTFQDMSVVYMEQFADKPSGERFLKVRVPAVMVSVMYANLSIGNMLWDSFLGDEYDDKDPEPGWHPRIGIDDNEDWRSFMIQAEQTYQEITSDDDGDVDQVVSRYFAAYRTAEQEERQGRIGAGEEDDDVEDDDDDDDDDDGDGED